MKLFVAEKPSVAKAIAAELCATPSMQEGYLDCGAARVTWCFGHLLEMAKPDHYDARYSTWRAEDLPIIPEAWALLPKSTAKKQLAVIGRLLKQADEVVNAGDPDREGQLLVDEVLEHYHVEKPVRRFWVSAQDATSIQRGLAALKDNRTYRGLRNAALARGRADWLVGMNLSRAFTLRAQRGGAAQGTVLSVGRVQTPTLALVVQRDREIEAFTPMPYHELHVELEHPQGTFRARWQPREDQPGLDSNGRLLDPAIADAIADAVRGQGGVIAEYRQEKKSDDQPCAYTLTSLTLAASNKFGYTAEAVLQACQALYEKHKLASYPRTDCAFLPEAQHADAPRVLSALRRVNPALAALVDGADARIKSKTWNDGKVTAHHGIIPTMHEGDLGPLSETERNVYELIVRSYLAQFYPPHEYLSTSVKARVAGEAWGALGKTVTRSGWRDVYPPAEPAPSADNEHAGQVLPPMEQGDEVKCLGVERKDLKTKPPPRFTEGTLVVAMENIHRFVTDPEQRRILKDEDGIGTAATRPVIIGDLKRRGFLDPKGKQVISTELGRELIDILPADVKSPSLTAVFERQLREIAEGKGQVEEFVAQQERFVRGQVALANDGAATMASAAGQACPQCGQGSLRRFARRDESGYFWGCSRFKDGCKAIYEDRRGRPVLEERKCPKCGEGTLRRIARKDGGGHFWGCSRFKEGCKALYQDRRGTPDLEPKATATKPAQEQKCPGCGVGVLTRIPRKDGSGHFWGCSRFKEGCKATYKDRSNAPVLEGASVGGASATTGARKANSPVGTAAGTRRTEAKPT